MLVTGPRLAGKTRTAYEALVAELPDARVIAPRSAAAFARLLALEEPPGLRASRYFGDRYAACLRGATPEYPACAIVLDPQSQREWAARNGYWACRSAATPEACAARLP